MSKKILVNLIIILAIFNSWTFSDSFFSSMGYGEKTIFSNAFNASIGNTGIAVFRDDMPNIYNTALNTFSLETSYVVNYDFEAKETEIFDDVYDLRTSNFPSFFINYPIKPLGASFSTGMLKLNDFNSQVMTTAK